MTTLKESFASRPPFAPPAIKPKVIGNNTFSYTLEDGTEVIRLHRTDIVFKHPDGKVTLTSGGWKTPTTKARMNDWAPYRVTSNRGLWEVSGNGHDPVPFYDGIVLPDAFQNPPKEHADKKLAEAIRKFVKKTLPGVCEIPKPSGGDCWYCSMFDAEQPDQPAHAPGWVGPQTQRDRDNDHLLSHIEEGYMPGSLILNACRACGCTETYIGWRVFGNDPDHTSIRRYVTRYLRQRLGLPT